MKKSFFDNNQKLFVKHHGGFIIFFALIVSSIVLTAGLAVSRIIIRQIYLASVQRDSQVALFGAESGKECARYYAQRAGSITNNRTCNGQIIELIDTTTLRPETTILQNNTILSFWFNMGKESQKTCVKVEVNNITRRMVSRGYNVECDPDGNLVGDRITESKLIYKF